MNEDGEKLYELEKIGDINTDIDRFIEARRNTRGSGIGVIGIGVWVIQKLLIINTLSIGILIK